jgi:ABC-type multidrug transport system fused ATPase/permease subunit
MKLRQLLYNPIIYPILSIEKTIFMAKFIIILLVLYVIYYIGNIVYDLFIKKGNSLITEESDVFSITEFEEQNRDEVTSVGIEDVENLNTPKSFNKREFPINEKPSEERQNIDVLRQRFESEQNIDSFDPSAINQNNEEEEDQSETHDDKEIESPKEDQVLAKKANKEMFDNFLNLAETLVQLVSNNKGHKVYNAS